MNLEVTGGFSRSLFLRAARAAYKAISFVAAMSVFSSMSAKAATAQVTIEQQPQNATIAAGQTATFTASASTVCRSVWYRNGSFLAWGPVAQTVSYTTPATTAAMSGAKYTVLFYGCKGASGKVLSQPAVLSVTQSQGQAGPSITSQPSSETVPAGQTATFKVAATGTTPLGYQWHMNGSPISGATAASYTTPPTTTSQSGEVLQVAVSNLVGSTMSNSATLTVTSGTNIATVTVDATTPGRRIASDFGGISTFSISDNCDLMGPGSAPNPIYRELIKNLIFPGQSFLITAEDDDGPAGGATAGGPSATQVSCPAQLYTDLKNAGYSFTYWNGVPLCGGNQTLANEYATAFLKNMPSGWAPNMVIGNEPDGGCGIGYATYASRFATWTSGIRALSGGADTLFMGPQLAATGSSDVDPFIAANFAVMNAAGEHGYPMAGGSCSGNLGTATISLELSKSAATYFNSAIASQISEAHSKGIPFRMSETNSAFCGGKPGVSDAFASALWVMDYLFNLASAGVDGVNIFSDEGDDYDLFGFTSAPYHISFIRPEYYGLMVFQQATQNGPRLLPLTLSTSSNISAWATLDASNVVRVLIINKDQTASGDISVALVGFGNGTLSQLVAPSVSSKTGVTWAGQTFDGSPDGTIQGTQSTTTVTPSAGLYTFTMGPATAALLTVSP